MKTFYKLAILLTSLLLFISISGCDRGGDEEQGMGAAYENAEENGSDAGQEEDDDDEKDD